jgi:uncharacterized protein (DUF302 family)
MSSEVSFQILLSSPFDDVMQTVKDALQEQGFGVLTEIDVQSTLNAKLGQDFRRYTILGACNPPFAHEALLAEPEIGIVLPCNVTLDQQEDGVLVSFANPEMMLSIGDFGSNQELREIADSVTERIVRVVESLKE